MAFQFRNFSNFFNGIGFGVENFLSKKVSDSVSEKNWYLKKDSDSVSFRFWVSSHTDANAMIGMRYCAAGAVLEEF